MRYHAAAAITALSMSIFPFQVAFADRLNNEQLKKLLSNNTLYVKVSALTGNTLRRWLYFRANGTLKVKTEIEGHRNQHIEMEFESSWKVTSDGTYCYKVRSGKLSCSSNVRVEGDSVLVEGTLDGSSDGEHKYKLLRGNPKSL